MIALSLIPLYLVAVTLPLILAAIFGGPPRPFHQELASGLGILAFAIVLAEFVLSGRFKSVANRIGMDVTMRFHQLMARTALLFALVHPFLYQGSPSGGQRPWDPSRQLTLTTDLSALATGIAAYLLLPSLVLLSIYRTQLDYKYETWRLMHGISALLIALFLLHHTIYAGRYGAETPLTWLWVAMTAIAVGSLIYVYLIVPMKDKRQRWQVSAINRLSPRQWEVIVSPRGHSGLNYKAGQFVWLNIGHSPYSLHENPFSISSAPSSGPNVSFVIKELGDFTRSLHQVQPGTRAYLDGPYGSLTIEDRCEPGIVLVAGGVGIAPLLGIVREIRLTGDPRKVRLIYGNRTEEQILYADELADEDVTHVLTEPPQDWQGETGLIDAILLDLILPPVQVQDWLFVLCGPSAMMDTVEDYLIARGTPSGRILSERFEYD
ncbi:ferredoxin reductase family protein [Roseibium salinum]|uniref:Ferredoxin reductase family protein n=1 Tax=Roseibium salinum TaxID=1604349 RepID=A0ABT3R2T3_9HYPH|nr:ferredoxin reductase family protein [Roseibium sp. DSM 29163]MCX2723277.1 ferredoxin reductase family protein [Roseibium sp. DSM 29163]